MKKLTFLFLLSPMFLLSQTFGISLYVSGLSSPVEITHAPNDNRLFVVQQSGAIRIVKPATATTGTLNAANFLTLTTATISTGGERGLLGLAFHPDYATNGYFYIDYTRAGDGATVIARYQVSTGNADIADAASGTILLTISQPFANHNGGTLRFGTDGYLYIGMGDGGSGGDPGNRAQNINENLGKMLRIDVDSASPYGIPPTNPFATTAGNDEIWAVGLRNPWKWSFNRLTGDLWIADVGQGEYEEVNKVLAPLSPGLNFGWRCYEGNNEYNTSGCLTASNYTFPLEDYTQSSTGGCAVTGGYYYTGSMYPNFLGKYIFGDYCLGKIFTLTDGGTLTISPSIPGLGSVTTFGEDINGELYVANAGTGAIFRVIDTSLGLANAAENGFSMYPNPAGSEVFIRNTSGNALSKIRLYDLSGKLLLAQNLGNIETNTVNTASLASGMYVAIIEDVSGARFTTKLTIK
jgi:glucose/arabinose dehydrogenase